VERDLAKLGQHWIVLTSHAAARQHAILEGLTPPSESLWERAYRFGRALIVGSGATAIDFAILTSCIRVVGLAPTVARVPALLAGASFQFFGNRTFTFHAQAGSLSRQAKFFVAAEVIDLLLNYSVFRFLVPRVTFLPPEIVSFIGTFIVFVTFAYPVRKLLIFRRDV
jgi:putative flippase GtrA